MHNLIDAVAPSHKRDSCEAFGVDRLYGARSVVWDEPPADQSGLESVVAFMCTPYGTDTKVADPNPVSLKVPSAYEVEFDEEGNCDLSEISPSDEIVVRSSLQRSSTVIHNKCVKYLAEIQNSALVVF